MDMETYIETQTKILQSETLALQTIKSLDLGRYPEFGGSLGSARLLGSAAPLAKRPAILGAFLGRSEREARAEQPLDRSDIRRRRSAAGGEVVNAHLQNYIEQNFRSKYDATTQASNWLSSELEELRIKVEKSEDARIAYERENQIWQIDEKQDITTQKLADLSKAVTEAQTELAEKEALYRMAMSGNVDALPAARDNAVIQDLLKSRSPISTSSMPTPRTSTARISRRCSAWPRSRNEVDDDLAKARQDDRGRHSGGIQHGAQPRGDSAGSARQAEGRGERHGGEAGAVHILQHDAESNKQLYDGLLQKLKEAGITAGLRSSNIRVVDPALVPDKPVASAEGAQHPAGVAGGPRGRNRAGDFPRVSGQHGEVAGRHRNAHRLAFAGGGAFAAGHRTATTADCRGWARDVSPQAPGGPRVELLSYMQPKSQISEAFRALRTSLLLSQAEHPPQVILVTSALPREGKTTAAVNLAVTLAQLGDRTLLMDSDLRKPGIRRALNLTSGKERRA